MDGLKFDGGKLRWDLLPLDVVEKLVEIYEFGANKYGENNWRNLQNGYKRCRAALFRHLTAYDKGEHVDSESGKSHLAHAAWNALSMVYFAEREQEKPTLSQYLTDELSRIAHEDALEQPVVSYKVENIYGETKLPCVAPYKPFGCGELLRIDMEGNHYITQNYWHSSVYDMGSKGFIGWSAFGFREKNKDKSMVIYPATKEERELYYVELIRQLDETHETTAIHQE